MICHHKKWEIVGFLALNLKLIYFNYSINLCFDDNKSDFFFIENFINLNRPFVELGKMILTPLESPKSKFK